MQRPRPLQGYHPWLETVQTLFDLFEFLGERLHRTLVSLPLRHAVIDERLALVRTEHQGAPLVVEERQFLVELAAIVDVAVIDHVTSVADDRLEDLLARVHLVLEHLKRESGQGKWKSYLLNRWQKKVIKKRDYEIRHSFLKTLHAENRRQCLEVRDVKGKDHEEKQSRRDIKNYSFPSVDDMNGISY